MGKFQTGRIVLTSGVYEWSVVNSDFARFVQTCLKRHIRGDWGNLSAEDRELNDKALKDGSRLLSAYEHWRLPKIWIITEADRSVTTVLFPEDY